MARQFRPQVQVVTPPFNRWLDRWIRSWTVVLVLLRQREGETKVPSHSLDNIPDDPRPSSDRPCPLTLQSACLVISRDSSQIKQNWQCNWRTLFSILLWQLRKVDGWNEDKWWPLCLRSVLWEQFLRPSEKMQMLSWVWIRDIWNWDSLIKRQILSPSGLCLQTLNILNKLQICWHPVENISMPLANYILVILNDL